MPSLEESCYYHNFTSPFTFGIILSNNIIKPYQYFDWNFIWICGLILLNRHLYDIIFISIYLVLFSHLFRSFETSTKVLWFYLQRFCSFVTFVLKHLIFSDTSCLIIAFCGCFLLFDRNLSTFVILCPVTLSKFPIFIICPEYPLESLCKWSYFLMIVLCPFQSLTSKLFLFNCWYNAEYKCHTGHPCLISNLRYNAPNPFLFKITLNLISVFFLFVYISSSSY